jgi:hypothetical protein
MSSHNVAQGKGRRVPADRRNSARVACVLAVGLSLLLAGSAVAAQAALPIGGAGKRGPNVVFGASCKYGSAPFPGYLRVATRPPKVQGAPTRSGPEWVRYRAWLVDSAGNDVLVSPWSGWLQARDGAWATWRGETVFTANWRGNYRIEFRIEWWNKTQRIGWQAHRITDYLYFDEWNTAWGGPFTSCVRQPV